MKKFLLGAVAAASVVLSPVAMASSPYIAATGGLPVTFTGSFNVFKGISITNCAVTFVLNGPNNAGDGHIPSPHTDLSNAYVQSLALAGGSPPLCGPGVVYVSSGAVEYASTNTNGLAGVLTVRNLLIDTPLTPGGCFDDIQAVWNEGEQTLTFGGLLDPFDPATAPCNFVGTLIPDRYVDFSAPGDAGH